MESPVVSPEEETSSELAAQPAAKPAQKIETRGSAAFKLNWLWIALSSVGIVLLFVSGLLLWLRPWERSRHPAPTTVAILPPGSLSTAAPTTTSQPLPLETARPLAIGTPQPGLSTPLPTATLPTLSPPPAAGPATYVVQPGDTLSTIAEQFGISMDELKAANGLSDDTIYAEQELIIPANAARLPAPATTPTPPPANSPVHTVVQGETLSDIAQDYGVSVEAIQSANGLTGEIIHEGDQLIIPGGILAATPPPSAATPTEAALTAASTAEWKFSILEGTAGELAGAYSAEIKDERFTLHYTPGTVPAQDPQALVTRVEKALNHIEAQLDARLDPTFDVYVAGTLFAPPDLALRGRSFSSARRSFFLEDGTGNPADQLYITTHELTHLFAWNVFGRPTSALVSEGLAVYVGMSAIPSSAHLPLQRLCTAYQRADRLPRVSGSLTFEGHIRDYINYEAAGCFTEYLITTYGVEKYKELYSSGNYQGIYGRSLSALETEWIAALKAAPDPNLDGAALLDSETRLGTAYENLYADFSGTPEELATYRALDRIRLALVEGRLTDARAGLDQLK